MRRTPLRVTDENPDPATLDPQPTDKMNRSRALGSDKNAKLAAALRSNLARRKAAARIVSNPDRGET